MSVAVVAGAPSPALGLDAAGRAGIGPGPLVSLTEVRPSENLCPASPVHGRSLDLRCWSPADVNVPWLDPVTWSQFLVDDGTVVSLLGLPGSDDAARALAAGKAVVDSPFDLQGNGTVHLEVRSWVDGGGEPAAVASDVPAVAVDLSNIGQFRVILPPTRSPLGLSPRSPDSSPRRRRCHTRR